MEDNLGEKIMKISVELRAKKLVTELLNRLWQ